MLAFVRCARIASAASFLADRVDFVDKHDARRVLPRLGEEIAHSLGAHACVQFDKIRAAHIQKRNACFACRRFREQRLAGTGRPGEQSALGNASSDVEVFLLVFEEVDEFHDFRLGLVDASDVFEANAGLFHDLDLLLDVATHHVAHFLEKVLFLR